MAGFKNEDNGTWYVMFRYTDWKGERKQKCKRGFPTRAKALEWKREFLQQKRADVDIDKEELKKARRGRALLFFVWQFDFAVLFFKFPYTVVNQKHNLAAG